MSDNDILFPDLSDIPDPTPVPEGEYILHISAAKAKQFNSGRTGMGITCQIMNSEGAPPIFLNFFNGKQGDDPDMVLRWSQEKKAFLKMIDERFVQGCTAADLIHREFKAYLVIEAEKDKDGSETGRQLNVIKRFLGAA